MGGGLMQLVAYGAQDVYLTGNPQITFFKVVYRRHTNFSMEHIQQTFKGTPNNNARVVATVARNGDLIHDCFLKINNNSSTNSYNPGHNILDNVEVEIGGQSIDKQYGHFMEAHAELTEQNYGGFCTTARILTVGATNVADISPFQYTAGAGGVRVNTTTANLYVPLRFWFCRHVGLSLPLIALQYHEVNVNVTFSGAYSTIIKAATEPQLWVNYIYLDTDERRRFAQVSHEYLIEQVQTQEFSWRAPSGNQTFKLNFNHPVKELIWAATKGPLQTSGWGVTADTNAGSFDNFATADTTMKLRLNGHDRFASQDVDYFTRYQPMEYHENLCRSVNMDQIGVYSFALKPEEHQPSGTCNFSRIDSAEFELTKAANGSSTNITLQMYAINYNVLRIMSGMGGLAYSN